MRPSPIERARICSYLYSGLKRFHMHAVVDLIPLLLHMSLLLFFAGLVVFLFPINRAMVVVAASLLSVVAFVYAVLTFMPLLVANCPCRTPLSGVFWCIGQICVALSATLRRGMPCPNHSMEEVMLHRATAESDRRTERDKRALCWTLKSLTAENELEPFVEAIPQVIWSLAPLTRRRKHDHLLQTLIDDSGVQLGARIAALLRTCESGLLEESVRQHRTVLCLKALLAFAMAAERSPYSLVFPFEHSTFMYLSTTRYPPARTYIPALRACGIWSLFCTFLANVKGLLAACDAEIMAKRDRRLDLLLPALHKAAQLHQNYTSARDSSLVPQRSELDDFINNIYAFRPRAPARLEYLRQILQRLLDRKASVQLDIFRSFLLDSATSDCEPYNFWETIKILRPERVSDPSAIPKNLGSTFRAIVTRVKNEDTTTHIDRAVGVYMPLFDTIVDTETENRATDALIVYINGRDLSDAILRVLRDCDVDRVWIRVTHRLSRRDQLDDVLTAVWRLCDLFLDPQFGLHLASIPLYRFIETALKLPPVSQYNDSVEAMLRTVALHAAQTVHIPIVTASDSPAVKSSWAELKSLTKSSWISSLTATEDNELLERTDPSPRAAPQLNANALQDRFSMARLALLTDFLSACASPPLPYNVVQTLAHIGTAPAPVLCVAESPELQIQFAEQLRNIVKLADEPLLQTVLECPLVSGLQWVDDAAVRTMRSALDKAMLLGQQLPIVLDTLNRLPLVGDVEDTTAPIEIVHD